MTIKERPIDHNEQQVEELLTGVPTILPQTVAWMKEHYNARGRVSSEWIETFERIPLELERKQPYFDKFIKSVIHQPMFIFDNQQRTAFRWIYISLLVQAGLDKQAREASYTFTGPSVDLLPVSKQDVVRMKFIQPEETPTWNGISTVLERKNNGLFRIIQSHVNAIGSERSREKTLSGIANILLILGQRGRPLRQR